MTDSQRLLAEYVDEGSESAFRELVARFLDLVHSTALRLVRGDAHLAEDVAQIVFTDLAKMARTFSSEVMLGGWLHRHTCFVAANILRAERRRQWRERQAVEMNSFPDHSEANFAQLAPVLDDAINQLSERDRAAILLRYFEQNDLRTVGAALGGSEDAAQKRIGRALEKLRVFLKNRGVTFSTATLGSVLAAEAVTAAPAGLVASISGVALAGAASGGITAITVLKIMTMTKIKFGIIGAVIAAAGIAVPLLMEHQELTRARKQNAALRAQVEERDQWLAEKERLLAATSPKASPPSTTEPSREVLKLRGEVGKLRQEKANAVAAAEAKPKGESALSGITSDPQMSKLIRDQQKAGMKMMYGKFSRDLKLSSEQTEKLNDLLADHIMDNIADITTVLRDGKTGAEREQVFANREADLLEKLPGLVGQENVAKFQEYSRDMGSYLTAEQFKPMLTGDKTSKEEHAKQIFQAMQTETQATLANAGLDPNFQTVPMLNFRNIASEEDGEKNIKLLEGIYQRVTVKAASFLNADELKKFQEFQTTAVNNNRAALIMNRKMMAPTGK